MKDEKEMPQIFKEKLGDGFKFVKEDDTFEFKCKQCGACCINRDDILVSPLDIYKGAKVLNMDSETYCKKFISFNLGPTSGLPVATMGQAENGFCSLLVFDPLIGKYKCRVHNGGQPFVCSAHPIGRIMKIEGKNQESIYKGLKSANKINYDYVKVESCRTGSINTDTHVIKDWLDNGRTPEEEYWSHMLTFAITDHVDMPALYKLATFLSTYPEREHDDIEFLKIADDMTDRFTSIYNSIAGITYMTWDINQDFVEQAKKKINDIEGVSKYLRTLADLSFIIIEENTGVTKEYILSGSWNQNNKQKEEKDKNG